MQKSGKDNSGEKIYVKKCDGSGDFLLDDHGHLIIDHDLFNHEGKTEDGIAEAFIEFSKKENFSFFKLSPSVAPFDAVKYQSLMDGLEAVELNLSRVLKDNLLLRLDSEYFGKYYLACLEKIENHIYQKISEFSYVTDGIHESIDFDEDGHIFSFSAKYPKENYFDLTEIRKISARQHQLNPRTQFKENDVIISTVGTIGNCAVVDKSILPANCDRDVGIIRIQDESVKPRFLSTFLVGKYGRFQSRRESTGNVQLHLFIYKIKEIKVPKIKIDFQKNIERIVKYSKFLLDFSRDLYQQAEDLLLSELNLKNWQPTKETIAIKSFKESFLSSSRLDAEYYQPKYDEIEKQVKLYSGGWANIRNILNQDIKNGTTPEGIIQQFIPNKPKFVRIEAFNQSLEIDKESLYCIEDAVLIKYKSISVFRDDVLVSMTGTIGNVAVYSIDDSAIINQNIVKLTCNKSIIYPYVLALYIKSIGRSLLIRQQTGNVQPYVNIPNFQNLIVPLLFKEVQDRILDFLEKASNQRTKSKQLLEIAKIGVEKAIETDEATAKDWINQQLENLGIDINNGGENKN